MPFRDVTLPDGSTVRARVSDQAIQDWLNTRAAVRNQYGFDRPPDWDTGPKRGWLPHVNDPAEQRRFEAFSIGRTRLVDLAAAADADPSTLVAEGTVITWIWETPAIITKLIVSWRGDGGFRVKWRAFAAHELAESIPAGRYIVDREWLIGGDHDIVEVGNWIEQKLIEIDTVTNLARRSGKPLTDPSQLVIPRIDDTGDADDAGTEAAADVIAEYGWAEWARPFLGPMPEGARVEA